MESSRSFLDRFYVCCNKIDGLYYLAARRLGVKEKRPLAAVYPGQRPALFPEAAG